MMILTLAWRNIWRQRRRTAFGLVAIAVTTAVVVFLPSLQAGSYASMVNTYLGLLDGYAQVQTPEYLDTPAMRESFEVSAPLRETLAELPAGVGVSERGIAYVLLSSPARSLGAQVIGAAPQTEPRVSTIPTDLVAGVYLERDDQIVLGETLARNLQIAMGDAVTLMGVGRDGSLAADVLTVAGLFRSGMPDLDRQLAAISLDRFDETFAMDGFRHAVVIGDSSSSADRRAVERLLPAAAEQGLAVRDWTELQPGLHAAIELDVTAAMLPYLVLVSVVVLSLLNTILMSVLERTREFGMLLALGLRPELLSRIVWAETGVIALVGVSVGMLGGALLTTWLARTGIDFQSVQAVFERYGMSSTIYPELTPLTLLAGPLAIAAALIAVGSLPARRVRKLNILDAMRGT
ncbi:MAG: FtsX-like permease family protein [Holophagales bacterium]|nr:FtsX-like permease family protein [Holophagales bacterium]